MKVDEIAEGPEARDVIGASLLIDPGLCLVGSAMGVVAAKECLAQQNGPVV